MRPAGPLPETWARFTPSTAATRAATGETFVPSGTCVASADASVGAGACVAPLPPSAAGAAAPLSAPTAMRAITCPTVTVSPSSTSSSVTVPPAGAGSSTSTLSVEISTIVASALMKSPTLACHSRIVPSVTDSPAAGVTTSTTWTLSPAVGASPAVGVSPGGSSAGALVPSAGVLEPFGAAPLSAPTAMRAITCPTVTVSPSCTSSSVTVPLAGAGSSTSTLSVEISTIVASTSIESPTLTCHSRIVPSVTDSPAAGVTTSIIC